MVLLAKKLLLRFIILWNFCEVIVSFIMFKFYEFTEETLQWILIYGTYYSMTLTPDLR